MAVDIIARLKLNAQEFSRGMKVGFAEAARDAEKQGTTAGTRFSTGFTNGMRALATGAIGAAIGTAVSRSLDYAASLGEVSQQLGVTTRELQVYRFAALEAGVSTKQMDDSLAKLTLGVGRAAEGNKRMTEVFAGLGVSVLDAGGNVRATGDVFLDLADALSKIPDPAKRAEAEVAIFGKTGQKLDTILAGGRKGLDDVAKAADGLGVILSDKLIQQADQAADNLGRMRTVLEAKMAVLVSENAQAFVDLADAIGGVVVKLGEFFSAQRGFQRLERDEGWWTAQIKYGLSWSAPVIASDPEKYANKRGADLNAAKARLQKLEQAAKAPRGKLGALVYAGQIADVKAEVEEARRLWKAALADPDYIAVTKARAKAKAEKDARGGKPPVLPPVDPPSGSSTRSTRASNDNEAARAAERAEQADKRRLENLREMLQQEQDMARIAQIRAEQGEAAAELEEARLDLVRQFPEYEGKSVEQIAKALDISLEQAKTEQEIYELLKAQRAERIGSAAAAEEEARYRDEEYERGQEIFRRIKKEREEQAEAERRQIEELAYLFEDVFRDGTGAIWDNFKREGERALADLASKQVLSLLGKIGIGNETLGALSKNAALGSVIGPGFNKLIGTRGSTTGGAIGGALGTFIPIPGGQIIGSIIGSTIGGMLKKAKYGTTVLNGSGLSTAGNSGSARSASVGGANSIQEGLAQIAEALGGDIGSYNVSIGTYKGKWRVSPSGYGGKLKVKNGAVDFGKDGQAEAIRFAISDALSDGAIKGISDAAQRILKSGQDLDKALAKAVDIESLPKLLKARLDPLGAALEAVDDKFTKLAATLKEGGASAEQIAQARQLWQLEREDTLAQIGQASAGLKDFLSGLKAGSASPFSLRDQEASARAALAPFQAQIAAGQQIDTEAFQNAADTFLSVERQIYGSTGPFFEALAQVSTLTEQAIAKIDAQSSSTGAAKDPFAELTATSAQATAANTQQAAQILDQQTQLLADIRNALAGGGVPANADWLAAWRGFRVAA